MKKTVFALSVLCLAAAAFGEATITDVSLRQRWPWGREVDVYFTVRGATEPIAVRPTFTVGGEPLTVADSALGGDRVGLLSGLHHLVWTPSATDFGDRTKLLDVKVSLAPAPMPLYAIYDLTDAGKPKNPTYVFEDDLRAGKWGTWQENPYDYINSVIWTGVTEDMNYKTNKLVLRYVYPTTDPKWVAHAGADTYQMGTPTDTPDEGSTANMTNENMSHGVANCSPQQTVKLTKGFWLGVFEVTQLQYALLTESWPAYYDNLECRPARPVECLTIGDVRGLPSKGYAWPSNGHTVNPDSFLGKLRALTGAAFDLPLEAQWEYACRAGSTGLRYGDMKTICRSWYRSWDYGYNQKTPTYITLSGGTAAVGTYAPNAWGLYDMLGNVSEFCLNAWSTYANAAVAGTDPIGPAGTDDARVLRGGEYYNYIGRSTAPFRFSHAGASTRKYENSIFGMRVCLPIE